MALYFLATCVAFKNLEQEAIFDKTDFRMDVTEKNIHIDKVSNFPYFPFNNLQYYI